MSTTLARITESRFKLAEFTRSIYRAIIPAGHTIDDIVDPAYWTHVAKQVKPHDRIEATAETGEFLVDLFVLASTPQAVKVAVITKVEFNKKDAAEAEDITEAGDFIIKWGGPANKFQVVRKSDKHILRSNLHSKAAAGKWLEDHLRAMAQ